MSRLELLVDGPEGQITLAGFAGILTRARLILRDLDSAISARPKGSLEWYITDLRIGSAVAVVESRPAVPEADERLAAMVSENFVIGLETIERGESLPAYFSDTDMGRVAAISRMLPQAGGEVFRAAHLNGGQRTATLTSKAAVNVTKLMEPHFKTIGSVSGKLEVISIHGPPRFNVYDNLTKRAVRCRFPREQLDEVAAALGQTVIVSGIVHRNGNGEPISVERPELRIVEAGQRPTTRDIVGIDPAFTGDEDTVDYISRRRNG